MITAFQPNAFQNNTGINVAFQIASVLGARKRALYTVDPIGMNALDWFDAMTLALSEHEILPRLSSEDEWQMWGSRAVISPRLSNYHIPSPYRFDNWRDWARSFNNALSTAGF